jgi:hypothetical protein
MSSDKMLYKNEIYPAKIFLELTVEKLDETKIQNLGMRETVQDKR